MDPPLRFVSMPGALRVRLPPNAGLSPAARAVRLSREDLAALRAGGRGQVSSLAPRVLLGWARLRAGRLGAR